MRIEDYALIGDCHTAALVGRDGSIDWLCLPRFDSGACFAALLGTPEHGRWQIVPSGEIRSVRRRYRGDSLILETTFETDEGCVTQVDFMPPRENEPHLVRMVVGVRGTVSLRMQFVLRFDYGSIVPWVRNIGHGIQAVAGPDTVLLRTPVPLRGEGLTTVAEFSVSAGERVPFTLRWHASHLPPPDPVDPEQVLRLTEEWWQEWSSRCTYQGKWRESVLRSLITLKALTYAPTGGIVAAPTTSLPEFIGGVRNWDYRFCWLRDAALTLLALMRSGYREEALAWREWLLRAVAGDPSQINIMYGLAGERRLTELTLDWLPGYEGSRPVRIGNAAHQQFQLDVFGEVILALYLARAKEQEKDSTAWRLQVNLMEFLEKAWNKPDEGIWEVRGPRQHFTHSKVMAWVAVDRMIKTVEEFGEAGPVDRWRALRDAIHGEVCEKGFDHERNTFVQYFGGKELDASLLIIPLVGFLPGKDPRMCGTVAAVERELFRDGFLARYSTQEGVDGLPPGEGAFLACTFWLATNYASQGRHDDAHNLFERLLALRNDVGLLSEEYDTHGRRLVGNFPQAFSHIGLVNAAFTMSQMSSPPGAEKQAGSPSNGNDEGVLKGG